MFNYGMLTSKLEETQKQRRLKEEEGMQNELLRHENMIKMINRAEEKKNKRKKKLKTQY